MSEYTTAVFPLGLIALMAVMIAVIAGSTGIRILFIDGEYRKIIQSLMKNSAAEPSSDSRKHADGTQDNKPREGHADRWRAGAENLLDMRNRRASNQRNVSRDGFSIGGILVVGFATTLGLIQSLHVSAALAAIFFSTAMIPFYIHARTVLGRID